MKCIVKGTYDYNFDENGNEIRCACKRCTREAYIMSENREYSGDYDGRDGLIEERAEIFREACEEWKKRLEADEMRKDYEQMKKII